MWGIVEQYGLIGLLLVVIVLLIENPDRALKLKAVFLTPFFNLLKLGSRQFIAAKVGSQSSEFLREHLARHVSSIGEPKIRVQWVRSPSDPVLSQDGTLILRLQETNDQTRNILAATRVALPQVVYPSLRPSLDSYINSAIDLTILRNLSEKLGKHAYPIFQRYFLSPEIDEDRRAAELFERLVKLDESGVFVSILIEELTLLGEYLFSKGDLTNQSGEIIAFIQFLLGEAERERGQKIKLTYKSTSFRVAIILLAEGAKARAQGLTPYLKRADLEIKTGCDSLYIAAYEPARDFLSKLTDALKKDRRLEFFKRDKTTPLSLRKETGVSEIVLFRRNRIVDEKNYFPDTIKGLDIQVNKVVTGRVFDISRENALVDLGEVYGVVPLEKSSWETHSSLEEVFQIGESYEFLVEAIDNIRGYLILSGRLPTKDPWIISSIPNTGDVLQTVPVFFLDGDYICRTDSGLELLLPIRETTWGLPTYERREEILGTLISVKVISVDRAARSIVTSLRGLQEDPWPKIETELPAGSSTEGIILEIAANFISVKLPNGLVGYLPKEYVEEAGYSYKAVNKQMKVGQKITVTISKVFVEKMRIRLDLPPKN